MMDVQSPPAIYAKDCETPPALELRLPLNRLNVVCRMLGAEGGQALHGCSLFAIGGCLVIVPKVEGAVTQADQDAVRKHEEAHCNGWPANHPDH